ncbi:uncharacterized protein LOC113221798 [Piliocolobus tephrosceles]|uniref:uncharacterized protein LOC113221798 n=1 Tax=Piliocolobus tephrosceles TaxID=591936 RepID=UPI00130128B3|nr:uncharacterized protein LOC113221798 [Piliocolobus tephrosceles]
MADGEPGHIGTAVIASNRGRGKPPGKGIEVAQETIRKFEAEKMWKRPSLVTATRVYTERQDWSVIADTRLDISTLAVDIVVLGAHQESPLKLKRCTSYVVLLSAANAGWMLAKDLAKGAPRGHSRDAERARRGQGEGRRRCPLRWALLFPASSRGIWNPPGSPAQDRAACGRQQGPGCRMDRMSFSGDSLSLVNEEPTLTVRPNPTANSRAALGGNGLPVPGTGSGRGGHPCGGSARSAELLCLGGRGHWMTCSRGCSQAELPGFLIARLAGNAVPWHSEGMVVCSCSHGYSGG